jgi:hypothetical protein
MMLGGRQGGSVSTLPLASTRTVAAERRGVRQAKSVRRENDRVGGFTVVEWIIIVAILGSHFPICFD